VNFLKAVFSGVAALTAIALIMVVRPIVLMLKYRAVRTWGDGFYVVLHWHIWPILCVSLLVFAAGFFWQYHQTCRRS
jgi:hypothetical protein